MPVEQPRRPRDGVTPVLAIADGRAREALDFSVKAGGVGITETGSTADRGAPMQAGLAQMMVS